MSEMFCFQCEQTAACTGCTGRAGVCGKSADVANLQDKLTGALIGLAVDAGGKCPSKEAANVMIDGLFTTITNVDFDGPAVQKVTDRVHELAPNAADYDMAKLWGDNEDIRSLKSLILFGLRVMAAYASHAAVLG